MPDKPSISSISPAEPRWGDLVTLDYDFGSSPPSIGTAYVQGFQNGELVASDGGFPLKTQFRLGPTTFADESQPAEGYAYLSSFNRKSGQERNQPLAEFRFKITP